MTLSIFSFQRAFTAKQQMALAAGHCTTSLAAIEAKDILDCLHLGLLCGTMDNNEPTNFTPTVNEFVANCKCILRALSGCQDNFVTISLQNNNTLNLKEQNNNITMKMNGERVVLPHLTLQNLYTNLVHDIQNNPDLYGHFLVNYTHSIHNPSILKNAMLEQCVA